MDQYDNPCAHYSLVHAQRQGRRRRPHHAHYRGLGPHTYMLRDAQRGGLDTIPAAAMPSDIVGAARSGSAPAW